MKNKAIFFIMLCVTTFAWAQNELPQNETQATTPSTKKDKTQKSFAPKPHSLRKVYNTIYIAPSVNWFSGVSRPFIRENATVTVIPAWMIDFRVGTYGYISTGLSYNTLGCVLSFPDDYINRQEALGFSSNGIVYRTYKVSYLEIPVTFKMISNYMGRWAFHGDIGARLGMKLQAKAHDVYTDFNYTDPLNSSNTIDGELIRTSKLGNTVNFLNVAASIRGGAQFYLGTYASLLMGLEYRYGFTPILNSKSTHADGVYTKAKSQQFLLTLGIIF